MFPVAITAENVTVTSYKTWRLDEEELSPDVNGAAFIMTRDWFASSL
jgi:hypothetical protein